MELPVGPKEKTTGLFYSARYFIAYRILFVNSRCCMSHPLLSSRPLFGFSYRRYFIDYFHFCQRRMSSFATTTSTTSTTAAGATGSCSSNALVVVDKKDGKHHQRSNSEIRRLVQERVKQRNLLHVHGKSVQDVAHPSIRALWKFMWQLRRFQPISQTILDRELPVRDWDWKEVRSFPENCHPLNDKRLKVTWFGHASVLLQFQQQRKSTGAGGDSCINVLCDPVFSERCSAVQWMGPQRIRRVPLPGDEDTMVPNFCRNIPIHLVLISHNHYDHLDYNTVRQLHQHAANPHFIVPLGLGEWFRNYIDHPQQQANITELDWHESITFAKQPTKQEPTDDEGGTITITALPMRHWSNRYGYDRDQTLWCGYSIQSAGKKFMFAGDTAYFDEMQALGDQYGPWDAGALPIGAYEPRDVMESNHMNVPEAVRGKDLLQIANVLPIHWGTFPLTIEPTLEPRDWLLELMKDRPDANSFVPWYIGESNLF